MAKRTTVTVEVMREFQATNWVLAASDRGYPHGQIRIEINLVGDIRVPFITPENTEYLYEGRRMEKAVEVFNEHRE